jgi:hypothetical protein
MQRNTDGTGIQGMENSSTEAKKLIMVNVGITSWNPIAEQEQT